MPSDREKMELEAKRQFDDAMAAGRTSAAQTMVLLELITLLINKGVLGQGEVVARYREMSQRFMTIDGSAETVALADLIADHADGKGDRQPS